ncbi:type II secretion system protein [Pseudohongiella nitratireducens]|uniref:type II secretion system protein n=1 Tax=Pseudohongiella nitratireducens TaxID=1768907 RepID=UPI0030EEFEB8|tara:strand:- start:3916 stop:4551 length:636 start_codon:yes stop_codon:yes gene_type:complete
MNIQLKAKRQDGFTIIELVVVILLLGILAATALPRFLDVTDEAHAAAVQGVEGGLSTGVALFRATWVATGQDTSSVIADFGDGTLFANTNGYPIGPNNAIGPGDCKAIFDGVLQGGRPLATADADGYETGADTEETEVEAVTTATPATEWVVLEQFTAPATIADTNLCNFYYTGQYKSGDGSEAETINIPKITLNLTTGEITTSTLALDDA